MPALFIRNEDGSESLTILTVTAQEVIIHRVAHQMILRRGHLVACLVNKAFSGAQQHAAGRDFPGCTPSDPRPRGDPNAGGWP